MTKLNSKLKTKLLKTYLKRMVLIGIKILALPMLLGSCKKIEYVYITPPKEPITCIKNIKTPLKVN